MVDPELLEELVAFHKYGTLSATAEHLMITQPTVTRGMKKLEQQLGVTLFNREFSNRIELNDTGLLAATEAQKLLQEENNFVEKILNYDHLKHKVVVGSVAPGPIGLMSEFQEQLSTQVSINHQLIAPANVVNDLRTLKERLIFTDKEIATDDIESLYMGTERLSLGIDKFHPLAQRKEVSFQDLAGLTFLVVQDIGPWQALIEKYIPDAKFLYQKDLASMRELSQYSSFPFFFTNLTGKTAATFARFSNNKHSRVPIIDPHNQIEFYGTYLKQDRKLIQPLLKQFGQFWTD